MESSDPKALERQPYEKPEIHEIELVAEEVLAAGCKNNIHTGPGGSFLGCIDVTCYLSTGS